MLFGCYDIADFCSFSDSVSLKCGVDENWHLCRLCFAGCTDSNLHFICSELMKVRANIWSVLTLLIVVRSSILSYYSAVLMRSVIQYDIGTYVAFVSLHVQIRIFTLSLVS